MKIIEPVMSVKCVLVYSTQGIYNIHLKLLKNAFKNESGMLGWFKFD